VGRRGVGSTSSKGEAIGLVVSARAAAFVRKRECGGRQIVSRGSGELRPFTSATKEDSGQRRIHVRLGRDLVVNSANIRKVQEDKSWTTARRPREGKFVSRGGRKLKKRPITPHATASVQ